MIILFGQKTEFLPTDKPCPINFWCTTVVHYCIPRICENNNPIRACDKQTSLFWTNSGGSKIQVPLGENKSDKGELLKEGEEVKISVLNINNRRRNGRAVGWLLCITSREKKKREEALNFFFCPLFVSLRFKPFWIFPFFLLLPLFFHSVRSPPGITGILCIHSRSCSSPRQGILYSSGSSRVVVVVVVVGEEEVAKKKVDKICKARQKKISLLLRCQSSFHWTSFFSRGS